MFERMFDSWGLQMMTMGQAMALATELGVRPSRLLDVLHRVVEELPSGDAQRL